MLSALPESLPSASLAASLNPAQSLNFRLLLPFAAFPLLLIALLIVLPGIREQRALSLLAISLQLAIGALLIGSIMLPFWKVTTSSSSDERSSNEVLVHLKAQSRQRHVVRMGIAVGLKAINISLDYIRSEDIGDYPRQNDVKVVAGLHLNEQFQLDLVSSMADELEKAFRDGMPFPMLRILEVNSCLFKYFSLGQQETFAWGRRFRNAGHFANALLWTSFSFWLLQCVLLALLPHHFAKAGVLCALLTLAADALFVLLSPSDLHIPFPAPQGSIPVFLHLRFGSSFWMSVCAALLALLLSITLCVLQALRLYSLHTFLSSSLDDTVGPPKCRFGGGRKDMDSGSLAIATCSAWALSDCSMVSSASTSASTSASLVAAGTSSIFTSSSVPSKCSVASSASSSFSISVASLCSTCANNHFPNATKSVDMIRRRAMNNRMMTTIIGTEDIIRSQRREEQPQEMEETK